jgi:tetratricopeptide (TPR) repeat protein
MNRNSGNGAGMLSRLVRLGAFLVIVIALNWGPAFVPFVRATSENKRNDPKEKLFRSAKKSMREGKYADALKIYTEAIGADPRDVQAILGASFANLKMQDYLHSFAQAMEALKLDPDNARAHSLAGV